MNKPDYQILIKVNATAEQAAAGISNVAAWWGTHIEGTSEKAGDRFTIRFGETLVDFLVAQVIPTQKIIWQVTGSHLHWLQDPQEWLHHRLVWEIAENNKNTTINFTQEGLTSVQECFDNCEKGWNFYIGESLKLLLDTGTGKPDSRKRDPNIS
ncbi:SRPBCC domain-containing protein [Mucilaginibacter angelicae]|uniref:SRPBCC domain-containing protein n=1 Tax=Mucilaginibacter angelicae TaxID=869718 RepID=A0ABV6LEZ7_9SPHI